MLNLPATDGQDPPVITVEALQNSQGKPQRQGQRRSEAFQVMNRETGAGEPPFLRVVQRFRFIERC